MLKSIVLNCAAVIVLCAPTVFGEEKNNVPAALQRWFTPQDWRRDTAGPILSLSKKGEFDDTHIFAPCVALENGKYRLWYCGSSGAVAQRVFQLGLAVGDDGKKFARHEDSPVFQYGDDKHSILTATLLRNADGSLCREDGKLRMWFSTTHFAGGSGLHTLHETTSRDGVHWAKPSEAQLKGIYAPTVIKEGDLYRMWYTDVSRPAWAIGYATSRDGRTWQKADKPVITVDQKWERERLFYPTVLKADGVYLMWYGSYWSEHFNKTALGLAVSLDGVTWHKNPHNPVLRPEASRPWESHYTTSQSVLRQKDGSFRIWYASRKKPPFVNKYFALNTAHWKGPGKESAKK